MTLAKAVDRAVAHLDTGAFERDLARRVAIPTVSQPPIEADACRAYLADEIGPALAALGCEWRIVENPDEPACPALIAVRNEDSNLPTIFCYGHGDVVRGLDDLWDEGLSPWRLERRGDRLYGRGTADNKGQHSILIEAQRAVLQTRGRLGFNLRWLIETGEEAGSAGLRQICRDNKDTLKADFLLASDGPRLSPDRPKLSLGTRGALNFTLSLKLRDGGLHSGNWGGLAANPATILANALASIADRRGKFAIEAWQPDSLTPSVKRALAKISFDKSQAANGGFFADDDWGDESLSAAERVYGWNSFEVLSFIAGTPDRPVNAIPPWAEAHCQLRYVVGTDVENILPALRDHLDKNGFSQIEISQPDGVTFGATRTDPEAPLVLWAADIIERQSGAPIDILPNVGGSLPTDIFVEELGLPMLWVPHSYGGCGQHGPNEHLLLPAVREGLGIMTALFWEIGEGTAPIDRLRAGSEAA
ncbi:MAG: M20 family metallopeptidase [Pseudomonadota bacterium]